ncbi:cartilage intermediate layer protein 2 [Kryptolebias marmoratus]|uniref:cartilage intermediate layer protein 2 n=1 Tax=Kryptolebias marmoratus TaxID=37003 RepID=UPI0007F8AB42|nr:cartilage intermediate layer protein 2 [Kryptolebias marmoratus]
MVKQISLTFGAVLVFVYVGLSHQAFMLPEICWTEWYNRDSPSGTGDFETLRYLRKENPGEICVNPLAIEVVTANEGIPASQTGQKFHVNNPRIGFACLNKEQKSGTCLDYKVRFGCLECLM